MRKCEISPVNYDQLTLEFHLVNCHNDEIVAGDLVLSGQLWHKCNAGDAGQVYIVNHIAEPAGNALHRGLRLIENHVSPPNCLLFSPRQVTIRVVKLGILLV